jgi:hypothetical protein
VNAGFFLLPSGDPAGIYKVNGQLVSDTRRPRGAVGFLRSGDSLRLIYAASRRRCCYVCRAARAGHPHGDARVDTTRHRGKLMLFTPAYHADTDTAKAASSGSSAASPCEWRVRRRPRQDADSPRRVRAVVRRHGQRRRL